MNAQEDWKREYRHFKVEMETGWAGTAFEIINNARRYVREAALERRIEMLERAYEHLKDQLEFEIESHRTHHMDDQELLDAWHDRV